jgi:DNA-binding LacI/PurR family transcriptional regulator
MIEKAYVNVRAIAEKAGVSPITVSRALRNAPNVAEATKAKVRKAAEALGYRPDPLVSAYASRMRQGHRASSGGVTLAWLSSDPPGKPLPWLDPYRRGVEQRAAELAFDLDETIHTGGLSGERVRRILEARGIRGVIIPNINYFGEELPELPTVVTVGIGPSMAERPQHNVSTDAFVGMGVLVSRLMSLGYRRIGFCEHNMGSFITQGQAWGGFLFHQKRLDQKDVIPVMNGLDIGNFPNECEQKFKAWVKKHQPDAVISGFNQAKSWLESLGISVPRDMGLAHYSLADDTPGWSGLDPAPEQMGVAAVDLLTAHILRNEYGTPRLPKHMKFGGRWVEGKTTRQVRMVDVPQDVEPPGFSHSLEWFHREVFE